MQSVSPSGGLTLDREAVWLRMRQTFGGGAVWSTILVLLLTYAVAKSTATANWVSGIEVIPIIAVTAAILMGLLAILPVPWVGGLGLGVVAGPVVAFIAAWPSLHAAHPTDVVSSQLIGIWVTRISTGQAANDPSFYLFLICWLMWITGGWLAWCVLRWRKPMLGLIPGAAAFATNVLNFPTDQNGYTLAILVLTLALLLWSNYAGSVVNATRSHVKLTGDARWDFWESGLVAMAALIVLGIMLPPMSTVDRTTNVESSMFTNWAELQARLSNPGVFTSIPGGAGTTGFNTDVKLTGSLQRTRDPVFTYTIVGTNDGPRYFRGLDETVVTPDGEWRFAGTSEGVHQPLTKGEAPFYGELYRGLALVRFDVHMDKPPIGNTDLLFYPGLLSSVNRQAIAWEVPLPASSTSGELMAVDKLTTVQPSTSTGNYSVSVYYSTATTAELESAGTNYPDWIQSFTTLPSTSAPASDGSGSLFDRIHALTLEVLRQQGVDPATANVYDIANAIQDYLRSSVFTYNLSVRTPPQGTQPIEDFLFNTHSGYCEYFATAMGDMLRTLGIPTRLVNGFGPGSASTQVESYLVRGEDAHTWVEVYFPNYGWIPFEPTNDNNAYSTIPRGVTQGACLRDNNCTIGGSQTSGSGTGGSSSTPKTGLREDPNNGAGGPALRAGGLRITATTAMQVAAGVIATLLLLLAIAVRYLRPRTVMAVWRRTLILARLAGARQRPAETPFEVGRRLGHAFPEGAEPIAALAQGFAVAAYAPPDVAPTTQASVMDAWSSLRPILLRRALARLRPSRP